MGEDIRERYLKALGLTGEQMAVIERVFDLEKDTERVKRIGVARDSPGVLEVMLTGPVPTYFRDTRAFREYLEKNLIPFDDISLDGIRGTQAYVVRSDGVFTYFIGK